MKVTFLGVGEACDEWVPNTSLLVDTWVEANTRLALLDCGFTVPTRFFRRVTDPDALDALWISHFHGDHFFGTPQLLLRFWQEGRRKSLAVLGQEGVRELVEGCLETAFPGVREKLGYRIEYQVMEPGKGVEAAGFKWRVEENDHGKPCLAVRIENGGSSVFYSGDGRSTPATEELARGCDLAAHEAYFVEPQGAGGHGSVAECIEFARRAKVKRLALVHLAREARRNRKLDIEALVAEAGNEGVFLPEAGDEVEV